MLFQAPSELLQSVRALDWVHDACSSRTTSTPHTIYSKPVESSVKKKKKQQTKQLTKALKNWVITSLSSFLHGTPKEHGPWSVHLSKLCS